MKDEPLIDSEFDPSPHLYRVLFGLRARAKNAANFRTSSCHLANESQSNATFYMLAFKVNWVSK